MVRLLRIHYYILIFCFFNLFSCKVKDLAVSDLDTNSIAFKEVRILQSKVLEGNIISLTVPYGTNLKTLTPTFSITAGGTSVPKADISQDFSVPVYYTTINPSGGKKIYTIKVVEDAQPLPEITGFKVDSVYAGHSFIVQGKNFGKYALDVSAKLVDVSGKSSQNLPTQLIDSTQISIATPDTLNPALYTVIIKIRSLEARSSKGLKVLYPIPEIYQISLVNILQNNDLPILGKYIEPKRFTYYVHLKNKDNEYKINLNSPSDQIWATIPGQVSAGKYSVSIINQSQQTESSVFKNTVNIYDKDKPFITDIITPTDSIKAGNALVFKTINLDKYPVRYYQITLTGSTKTFIMNGIFDSKSQTLTITLPSNITKENYLVSAQFTSTDGAYNYAISTDLIIKPL